MTENEIVAMPPRLVQTHLAEGVTYEAYHHADGTITFPVATDEESAAFTGWWMAYLGIDYEPVELA